MTQGNMNAPPIETGLVFSEREEQILAVAGELLLKWGYKRVTMEDIARYADIGKGTIYLHWKSRDALFQTLLLREVLEIWRTLMEQIRLNPTEIRYSRLMRAMMLFGTQRLLARALFSGDTEILGKLAGSGNRQLQAQQMIASHQFVAHLRDYGLLRNDDPIPQQIYMLRGALTGFFLLDPTLLEKDGLSLEQRADVLAQTIERLFEPPELPTDEELAKTAATMLPWMETLCSEYERIIRGFMTS
jgi:AcrR family transcriptional regulator